MTASHFASFDDFWPHYVREHSKQSTRRLHFLGTSAAVGVAAYGLLTGRYLALLAAPLCGYGPAWVSHFFIEKNRPATFDYPLWSLRGDFVMFAKMVAGSMDDEVARCVKMAEDAAHAEETNAEAASATPARGTNGTIAASPPASEPATPAVNAASLN